MSNDTTLPDAKFQAGTSAAPEEEIEEKAKHDKELADKEAKRVQDRLDQIAKEEKAAEKAAAKTS